MWIWSQAFHAPKRGSAPGEYEDAFHPERLFRRDLTEFHCAVADGASESAYSREWARLLVLGFSRRRLRLNRLRRAWRRSIGRGPVPWYLEEKIRRGAHAALVGLSIRDESSTESLGGSWEVAAVGDSCLFHVRNERLLAAVPVGRSSDFDNAPRLISTDATTSFGLSESCVTVERGEWRPRDTFLLVTDALAQWVLARHEAGRAPWTLLRSLEPEPRAPQGMAPFEALVSELRERGELRNDDTTLLRVEVA